MKKRCPSCKDDCSYCGRPRTPGQFTLRCLDCGKYSTVEEAISRKFNGGRCTCGGGFEVLEVQ